MPSIESLLKRYHSSNLEIRIRAAKMLLDRSGDVSNAILLDILEKLSHKGLGAKTQRLLRARADSSLAETMKEYLSSQNDFLRETACHVLGDTGEETHVEALSRHLNDPAPMVRHAALHALDKTASTSAKEALMAKLAHLDLRGHPTDTKRWLEHCRSRLRSEQSCKAQSDSESEGSE